jgi:hypothetical protein
MDWHELEKLKIDDLRAMAKDKELVDAVAGLSKEQLVAKLAESMGIPRPHRVVEGMDKAPIKARIHELQAERDQALRDGDQERQRRARREIHRQKRKLRHMGHRTH